MWCFNPNVKKSDIDYDLWDDFGLFPRENDGVEILEHRMDDNSYKERVRSLNKRQMEFFYHVLYSFKTNREQLI